MNSCNTPKQASLLGNPLEFHELTPVAPQRLGGLVRDQFCNGRLTATVGWHGGLVAISYWGTQHLKASVLFQTGLESAWCKLFRACVGLGKKRYYLPLRDTKLYPFGLGGKSSVIGVDFHQEILLLPDALVQRFKVLRNPGKLPVFIEMFHQKAISEVNRENRKWSEFKFHPKLNAMIAKCEDRNPVVYRGGDSLAQEDFRIVVKDAPHATTWIGMGCDVPMKARASHNGFKIYFTSAPVKESRVSFFLVFASSREKLENRLRELSGSVHEECDELVAGYEARLLSRPQVDIKNPVLNSAFAQYPEAIHAMKVPERPGAVRGTQQGYFVWGWDGMTPMMPLALANEPDYVAHILRFWQEVYHPKIGIPLQLTTSFKPRRKNSFPPQHQYVASLYHYVATSGNLDVAREVLPTCKSILDRCRERIVGKTGLVSGYALWPDFPEVMGEDGNDVSSLNNSLVYQGLRSVEYLAGALGEKKLSDECRDWAKALRASFVKYLYDEEKGYFFSSCSAKTLKPRKHYPAQAIFWLTPFARELVSHAPGRIATFLNEHLRSAKCLLTLPQWDSAWMADGNQLGSSYPTADYFYVNVHKVLGNEFGLKTWLGDVEWFWKFHTAPEAFTPEAENEDEFGPDNHGGKQLQAVSAWYTCLYQGVAGLDFDHEGITLTPWSDIPVSIRGLRLRGAVIDLTISGRGRHVGSLKLNGKPLPAGSRKISWAKLQGKTARLELVRSGKAPAHPVIVRADGLRVTDVKTKNGRLEALIDGEITGEVVVQGPKTMRVEADGELFHGTWEPSTGTVSIPFSPDGGLKLVVSNVTK